MTASAHEAFERLPERVKRCLRPSLRLRTIPTPIDAIKLGQSRIGGLPDVPPDFHWPRHDGLPLSFIAQLDLAELAEQPPVLDLPKQGSLAFFYDSDQRTWGFDPKDRGNALVTQFPGPASSLIRRDIPAEVPQFGRFHCCGLEFSLDHNLADAWSPHYDPQLSQAEKTLLFEYQEAVDEEFKGPRHRLGGHANCVQTSMELECQLVTNGLYCGTSAGYEDPRSEILAPGALDWRLLLQIDSDDDAGMMWGDCGILYYWIREDDLRARHFDKSWLILQCY